jgi:YggT family protein
MSIIISFITLLANILIILVVIKVMLSYFMDTYHPVRQRVDQFVDPMLRPIQKFVPPFGMMDFSPVILILVIQVIKSFLINFLYKLI